MRNTRRAGSPPAGTEAIPRYLTMAGSCYSLSGVCELMSSEAALLELAVQQRSLVAFDSAGGRLLFPVWQFPQGRLLPHLAETASALPTERFGPWETALWFTRRRKALRGDCAAQWLRRGGDPEAVRALAAPSGSHTVNLSPVVQPSQGVLESSY
jgi:hypothetical protein